jgi:hypothetical protein
MLKTGNRQLCVGLRGSLKKQRIKNVSLSVRLASFQGISLEGSSVIAPTIVQVQQMMRLFPL